MNDLFWQSNDTDRQLGYCLKSENYHCLLCDYETQMGYVYPHGEDYVDAKKQMRLHIEDHHISVFDHLVQLDKKETGLSEHQMKILKMFYDGTSDYDIQEKLAIGSISTIRNHRYALKEKEKQAKTFLTMMAILNKNEDPKKTVVKPHKTATMVDSRYDVTEEEAHKIIQKYFPQGKDGKLSTFSLKEKYKIIILKEIIKKFDANEKYTEADVDGILKDIYLEDYVTIRRYLIQYGFMDRERNGSAYWVKTEANNDNRKSKVTKEMKDRRKELIEEFKAQAAQESIESGVYQIKNLKNNKIYIGKTRNIHKLQGLYFQLNTGSFMNKTLQAEWTKEGEASFVIEVLEYFKEEDVNNVNKKLRELEQVWKEKLKPYGDKGYHLEKK